MALTRKLLVIGPGSISDDGDAGAVEFHPQGIGVSLDGVFRGDIGAAIAGADEAEHRGAEDEAAVTLAAHHRDDPPGEVVPAEEIGLELGAHQRRVEILDARRPGHSRRC